jgi:two-component system chemotaxis response regulator CheB
VGAAQNPYEARDMMVRHRPDVITLDVEMPRMDGIKFLAKYMQVLPTPTLVLSSLTPRGSSLAVEALAAGAVDVLQKPSSGIARGLDAMMAELVQRIRMAATARVADRPRPVVPPSRPEDGALAQTTDRVIGLGASTGGVAALNRILPAFPPWSPGIVVVQHMPGGFTASFAERLAQLCPMKVAEAADGDRVLRGHILVAPGGDRHLQVRRFGGEYRVKLVASEPVSGHCPSVDVFFDSLADYVGANASACLLTGMGADGAMGLLRMRTAGARTFAQDRQTCAVWGMPAAASELGAAERLVPLSDIPSVLLG